MEWNERNTKNIVVYICAFISGAGFFLLQYNISCDILTNAEQRVFFREKSPAHGNRSVILSEIKQKIILRAREFVKIQNSFNVELYNKLENCFCIVAAIYPPCEYTAYNSSLFKNVGLLFTMLFAPFPCAWSIIMLKCIMNVDINIQKAVSIRCDKYRK